jgi:hypothetical protein
MDCCASIPTSFSNHFFPFGHKETLYTPELGMWAKTVAVMSETIAYESANATTYTSGPSGATNYPTTGASIDHVYTIGRTKFSFIIKLPDTGDYSFILPPEDQACGRGAMGRSAGVARVVR